MNRLPLILLLAAFLSLPALAGSPPPRLMIGGRPVDPLCFTQWEELREGKTTDLADCARDIIAVSDPGRYAPSEGYAGTAYRFPDDEVTSGRPFVEYKYIGRVKDEDVVLVRESGGGAGLFTTLYVVRAHDESALMTVSRVIAGGDRCNGGVRDAFIRDGAVHYSLHLTPLALASLGDPALADEKGLSDCAACCYATAFFEAGRLAAVEIGDAAGSPADAALQGCLDRLVAARVKSGQDRLGHRSLRKLAGEFRQTCRGEGGGGAE